ncbi:PTS sugar transporter subunit IIA [Symmachiella dynata]|uniref:PTS sugar transporter subunit IIA n=1 Tax=Symmachiella dynata TaxID=2527995 RepID=UPI0030ED3BB9|tara:strand:- start:127 stop:696 length:570 start_codon:yes stop_codon:yes gene_type:complete
MNSASAMPNSGAIPVGSPSEKKPAAPHLDLTSVFRPNCIEMIRSASGKSSVISRLVQTLVCEERVERVHAEEIINGLLERERHGTSAIGKGLAFPHLRTQNVTNFVGAIGVAPDGINFSALDSGLTKLVFLTLSPRDGREQHITLLSRLVALMQSKAVNMQLHHQIRPSDVYDYLTDLDEQSRALTRRG